MKLVGFVVALIMVAFSASSVPANAAETPRRLVEPPKDTGYPVVVAVTNVNISVPTDLTGSYTLLELVKPSRDMAHVTTKRTGPSGTSYSSRLVNCVIDQARYTGTADTLADVKAGVGAEDKMYDLYRGSISWYIAKAACDLAYGPDYTPR